VRKVVEADAYIGRVKSQADREIRRTQRERDFLLKRYGPQLERWTESELQKHKGRRKSVLLLAGTVGFRQISAKLVVDNATAVLKWAKRACGNAVVVVEKVSKTALNEHLASTGEIPTGAHLEPATKKFFVK
jgi:phage host-nuclease inhibitor protein Gam